MIMLAALVLAGTVTSSPAPHGGWHICNHYATPMRIAVATTKDSSAHSWGWYTAPVGECVTPIAGDLDTSGRTSYFFYARAGDGTEWAGDAGAFLCLISAGPFDLSYPTHTRCAAGEARMFWAESIDKVEFTTDLKP